MVAIPNDVQVLEKLVIRLATMYDRGETCLDFEGNTVSDGEYDALYRILKDRKPDSKAFQGTSPSEHIPTGSLVYHNPPMTSIAKADGPKKDQIYQSWLNRCCSQLQYPSWHGRITQSFKHDGVAVRLYYIDGKLTKAGLRPQDGVAGTDITANIVYVKGVPKTLPEPWTLTVSGELECLIDDFAKVQADLARQGKEPRANPRNHTYGAINQHKDPIKTKDGRLSFVAYNVINFDQAGQYFKTEIERAKWCNKVLKIPHVRVEMHKFEDLTKMEEMVPNLPYEVDGVVLKVNNLEDQEQLGNSGGVPTGDPHGALAWKFAEEKAVAIVKKLEWNASRTGRIVPKAIFVEPVKLAGTMVSQATCNNYGWVKRSGVGPDAVVEVIKAGKIIPSIVNVIKKQPFDVDAIPKSCPSCQGVLIVQTGKDNTQDLICLDDDCPAKYIKKYLHFLTTLGSKGIGESALEKIVDAGVLTSMDQVFEITVADLLKTGEFTMRQATLAIAAIHMVTPVKNNDELLRNIEEAKKTKKKLQGWQFFAALGIPQAGKTAGKALLDYFGNIHTVFQCTPQELMMVEGIGEKTAYEINKWFENNIDMLNRVIQHIEIEEKQTGKLTGVTFALTGEFDGGKKQWEEKIQQQGGKISGTVGSKTNYLVAGENCGSKLTIAQEKGVKILKVWELQDLLTR